MANQSYLVDFNQGVTGDTGQDNVDAIQPVSDGEPATSTVFRRPSENLRARTELVRDFSRDMAYYRDFNHLGLWGTGTFTWGGSFDLAGTGLIASSVGAQVEVRPILTPGSNTKGQLVVGTSPNTVTYDVTATAYITQGMDLITVEHIDSAGTALTVTITPGPVKRIVVLFDSTNLAHNVAAVAGAVNGAITADVELTGKLTATPGAGTGVTVVQLETPILGTADEEAHIIQASDIAALGPLNDGDAVAVRYAYVVEEPVSGTPGGRWEANPARGTAAIPGASLFVTTNNPEYIPGALPLFKVQNDTLIWFNGARFERGVTVSITGLSAATVPVDDTVFSGTDTLVVNGGIDNPLSPTATVQTALESVDARLTVRRSVTFTVTDGVASTGGAFNNIQDAITALGGSGGHIYVRRGTYTLPAAYTIPAQIHLEGEDSSLVSITCATPVSVAANCRIEKVAFALGANALLLTGSNTVLEKVSTTSKVQINGDNCLLTEVDANAASAPSLQLVGNFNTVLNSNADGNPVRTLPLSTYVVGDGVTTLGDFNGSTGLNDCLNTIAATLPAARAERIEIIVHGGTTQLITGSKIISGGIGEPFTLVIRAGVTRTTSNTGLYGRPVIQFDGATLLSNQYGLAVSSNGLGNIVLSDLDVRWVNTSSAGRGVFYADGYIEAYRTDVRHGSGSPAVDAGYALLAGMADRCSIRNCFVQGRICMYNDPGTGSAPDENQTGVIEHSRLEAAQIVLHADTASVPGIDTVNGFVIRDCYIQGRATAPYTGSIGLIDARCARKLHISNCTIVYGINENGIDGRTYSGAAAYDWQIDNCRFFTNVNNGSHAAGAGTSGSLGTGWAVAVQNAAAISLRDCQFTVTSTDAGAVVLYDVQDYTLDSLTLTDCGHGAGLADSFDGIKLTGLSACLDGALSNSVFRRWLSGTTKARALNVDAAARLGVSNTKFVGEDSLGNPLSLAANYAAARFSTAESVTLTSCIFKGWNRDDVVDRVITLEAPGGADLTMTACTFSSCGQYVVCQTAGIWVLVSVDNCTVIGDGLTGTAAGFNLENITQIRATNNSFYFPLAPIRDAIVINTANFLVMGNNAPNGNIKRTAVVTGRGYAEAGQNLNIVAGYTT